MFAPRSHHKLQKVILAAQGLIRRPRATLSFPASTLPVEQCNASLLIYPTPEPLEPSLLALGLNPEAALHILEIYTKFATSLKTQHDIEYRKLYYRLLSYNPPNPVQLQAHLQFSFIGTYTQTLQSWVVQIIRLTHTAMLRAQERGGSSQRLQTAQRAFNHVGILTYRILVSHSLFFRAPFLY